MLYILHDNIARTVFADVSSAASGFSGDNLFDGNRHTTWRASTLDEQTITFDAEGLVGETPGEFTASYVALARADLLALVGATITVEHSDDMAAWTAAFAGVLLSSATPPLLPPAGEDFVRLFDAITARGWRLRISGGEALGAFASGNEPSFAGLWIGARTEAERGSVYGSTALGQRRTHQGAFFEALFDDVSEEAAEALLNAAVDVSDHSPGELPMETIAGNVFGGRPHFVYDLDGRHFRRRATGEPAGMNVVLMNPLDVTARLIYFDGYSVGPFRWRELR